MTPDETSEMIEAASEMIEAALRLARAVDELTEDGEVNYIDISRGWGNFDAAQREFWDAYDAWLEACGKSE